MFPSTKFELVENFTKFSEKELSMYSKKRNFDFGPPHKNVSKLSPYLRTRFISEEEVLKIAINKNNIKNIEKFIEEIFWRTYWRGWLETHPWIYDEYLNISKDQTNQMIQILENEEIAYDINSYRDSPIGLRIWCGATIEKKDLQSLIPWLEWAYQNVKNK